MTEKKNPNPTTPETSTVDPPKEPLSKAALLELIAAYQNDAAHAGTSGVRALIDLRAAVDLRFL